MVKPVQPVKAIKVVDPSKEIAKVIDAGGPLMQRAQTKGLQFANSRGLGKSSIAVGAATTAVLDKASEIGGLAAQIRHDTNAQRRNIKNDRYLQKTDINAKADESQKGRRFTRLQNKQDRGLQLDLQGNELKFKKGESERDRSFTKTQNSKDRNLTRNQNQKNRDLQTSLQTSDQDFRSGESGLDRKFTGSQADKDRDIQRTKMDDDRKNNNEARKLQERIATWNVGSADRNAVAELLRSNDATYENALANINSNKDLKAADRTTQIAALNKRREQYTAAIQAIYEVDIGLGDGKSVAADGGDKTTSTQTSSKTTANSGAKTETTGGSVKNNKVYNERTDTWETLPTSVSGNDLGQGQKGLTYYGATWDGRKWV